MTVVTNGDTHTAFFFFFFFKHFHAEIISLVIIRLRQKKKNGELNTKQPVSVIISAPQYLAELAQMYVPSRLCILLLMI